MQERSCGRKFKPVCTEHSTNGFPTMGTGQVQNGLWLTIVQTAREPQTFCKHGSRHLKLTHARSPGQSDEMVQSGLQPMILDGSPVNPGKHLHRACPEKTSHMVLAPHGVGLHKSGSFGTAKVVSYWNGSNEGGTYFKNELTLLHCLAVGESISTHGEWTGTNGQMVRNGAKTTNATSAETGILTLEVDAGAISWTV